MGKGRERDEEGGEEEGRREGREREGIAEGRGKVTKGMGGTEQAMGRDGEGRERRKGREREERGYRPPQTSNPGAATG